MEESCGLPAGSLEPLPAAALPEPARRLLAHEDDMTSTLAAYHRSELQVEILQTRRAGGLYLREVFLRTATNGRVVEYGVIAIALGQFQPEQQTAIVEGHAPLGALLHRFAVRFVSAPLGFFSAPAAALARTPLAAHGGAHGGRHFGRLNCLAQPGGAPLAWIVEILPQAESPEPPA